MRRKLRPLDRRDSATHPLSAHPSHPVAKATARTAKLASLAAAALVALAILPVTANAYVYWANGSPTPTNTIGRANLDGSGVNQTFITGAGSYGVAVDAGHVYWAGGSTIGRANLDGSGVNQSFITGAGSYGVAVDAGHLYWANGANGGRFPTTIGRANLDGTGVDQSFISAASTPYGVAVDAGHVYWANGGFTKTIGRANLDGTGVDQSFISAASTPFGVAVDAGHVYWANSDTDAIGRANLDGTGVDQSFISAGGTSLGVAVDADHLYWANGSTNTIGRANLDGSGVNQSFISAASTPFGVAVTPPTNAVSQEAPAGGTVSTNPTTSPADPVGTSVMTPVAGTVTIDEGSATSPPPSGYSFLGQQVLITAPIATAADPLVLRFILDASLLPAGTNEDTVEVFRNGTPVPNCSPGAGTSATPDPCVATRAAVAGGGVELTIRTSQASRWSFGVRAATVRVSGTALVVQAAPGAKDNLKITRPSRFTVRVTDFPGGPYTGSRVRAGAGCTQSGPYAANCYAAAITPALPALVTSAGHQADRVVNSSGLPSSLYGGAGDDLLIGGSARDLLNGGPGADLLKGLDGNDLLRARDRTSDQRIDCGGGSDKADLDLLPKDPNSVVKGCETKTRH